MMEKVIYVVDDELHIRELISYNLTKEGYRVRAFEDAEGFENAVVNKVPDLAILDIMLPNKNGLDICKTLRGEKKTAKLPVIMLTAKNEEFDKVLGLEIGADDYITKPFSVRELGARVKALLRRSSQDVNEAPKVIEVRDITVDIDSREVLKNKEIVILTFKEFELLKLLMQNKGKVLSRETLLNTIWGYDYLGETRTVDVHIRNLRKALKDFDEDYIETSRGSGYRFKA